MVGGENINEDDLKHPVTEQTGPLKLIEKGHEGNILDWTEIEEVVCDLYDT